ncbi:hypothetical protein [Streptomyces sp. NPDC059597]|uniref:hypothetical protein n=1 Tax=Streptomyces sp. NPDC059597 TaxID=3346879 RepID=UPI0036A967C4
MRHTTTIAALLLTASLALTGCTTDNKTATKPATKPSAPAKPVKLEPVWGPKLDHAGGTNAVAACAQPSSNACGRYVGDIMTVVNGLDKAIKKSGQKYPASTKEIAKIRSDAADYKANGCQGDPTAEDPNSLCHGVVGVTVGTTTLDLALTTDEIRM